MTNQTKYLLDECIKVESALSHNESKDIDATLKCSEVQAVSRQVGTKSTPKDILEMFANPSCKQAYIICLSL